MTGVQTCALPILSEMFGILCLSSDSVNRYGDMEDECLKRAKIEEDLQAFVDAIL